MLAEDFFVSSELLIQVDKLMIIIIEYMAQTYSYADPELHLEQIAQQVFINSSYLKCRRRKSCLEKETSGLRTSLSRLALATPATSAKASRNFLVIPQANMKITVYKFRVSDVRILQATLGFSIITSTYEKNDSYFSRFAGCIRPYGMQLGSSAERSRGYRQPAFGFRSIGRKTINEKSRINHYEER